MENLPSGWIIMANLKTGEKKFTNVLDYNSKTINARANLPFLRSKRFVMRIKMRHYTSL